MLIINTNEKKKHNKQISSYKTRQKAADSGATGHIEACVYSSPFFGIQLSSSQSPCKEHKTLN